MDNVTVSINHEFPLGKDSLPRAKRDITGLCQDIEDDAEDCLEYFLAFNDRQLYILKLLKVIACGRVFSKVLGFLY